MCFAKLAEVHSKMFPRLADRPRVSVIVTCVHVCGFSWTQNQEWSVASCCFHIPNRKWNIPLRTWISGRRLEDRSADQGVEMFRSTSHLEQVFPLHSFHMKFTKRNSTAHERKRLLVLHTEKDGFCPWLIFCWNASCRRKREQSAVIL